MSIENVFKVWNDQEGVGLEVGDNPDAPECGVYISNIDEKSIEWYGKLRLVLSFEEAKDLSEALKRYLEMKG